jgi:cullin-associated NEDD8-dissociated protein 1
VRTSSPAANTRATVAIAIKYSIVERPEKIDEIMYSEISTFLMLIKDSDRVMILLYIIVNHYTVMVARW